MPLPESIEKTYLPGDQIDATEFNAIQAGITANYGRIAELSAPSCSGSSARLSAT